MTVAAAAVAVAAAAAVAVVVAVPSPESTWQRRSAAGERNPSTSTPRTTSRPLKLKFLFARYLLRPAHMYLYRSRCPKRVDAEAAAILCQYVECCRSGDLFHPTEDPPPPFAVAMVVLVVAVTVEWATQWNQQERQDSCHRHRRRRPPTAGRRLHCAARLGCCLPGVVVEVVSSNPDDATRAPRIVDAVREAAKIQPRRYCGRSETTLVATRVAPGGDHQQAMIRAQGSGYLRDGPTLERKYHTHSSE